MESGHNVIRPISNSFEPHCQVPLSPKSHLNPHRRHATPAPPYTLSYFSSLSHTHTPYRPSEW
ncbi:hypothetical protein N7541_000479 [Penicillium brevicompactum]|uniref:Uncharacterized protein n=1 Tax=Penicillium brevicompactum TaxID=5074 RepID=A0A9W9RZ33_PENBR|nr:hypothetical protein N7541_000479 [Penicillium brevicompactum]